MANRKKKWAREKARIAAQEQLKNKFKQQKQFKKFGAAALFEAWKHTKFTWDNLSKKIQQRFEAPNIQARNLFKKYSDYKAVHRCFETVIQHPKLQQLSMDSLAVVLHSMQYFSGITRPIETWNAPKSKNELTLFNSVYQHLFVQYTINKPTSRHISPYYLLSPETRFTRIMLKIIEGKGLHQFDLECIKLNSKANYLFMTAPDRLSLFEAIWWAKIRQLGGSEQLAYIIIGQLEPTAWRHWKGWMEDFIHFCKKWKITTNKFLKGILNFTAYQNSFREYYIEEKDYSIYVPPIYPDYRLKGRTPASVQRHLKEWEEQIELIKSADCKHEFPAISVKEFNFQYQQQNFKIVHLKSYHQLIEEGRKMKHCVASYGRACLRGESSIWSLRQVITAKQFKRIATIELCKDESDTCFVEEFQSKCNTTPSKLAKTIVQQWSEQNNIRYELNDN